MSKATILLTIGTLLTAAPLAGQQTTVARGRATRETARPAPVEHAQLGLLEAVGVENNRVIIALPGKAEPGLEDPAYESYDTNGETLVEGLGSIMKVGASLAPYESNVVIVRYIDRDEHFLAKRIDFTGERTVHATRGSIKSVDAHGRSIILTNEAGVDETMRLGSGPGAVIDSPAGLRRVSDLVAGQHLTVYFGPEHRAELIWLE